MTGFRWGASISVMDLRDHARTTGGALKHWAVAMLQDALAVAGLWLAGLLIIQVPWAPLWAVLGGLFQFVPNFGPLLGLIGPTIALALTGEFERLLYLLILYAVIAAVDCFFLQPYFMRRTARVPIWASIVTPIVLGILIPFWGILLAPPLLAVVYAYRARTASRRDRLRPSSGKGFSRML